MPSTHTYKIRIRGRISEGWASWFEAMTVQECAGGDTIITAALPDQTALHGLLMVIRDLGLTLLEVKCIDPDSNT